ncbi:MAG: hypothetical protein VX246_03230 [Myxococcota bacterium]|nr:hypothetical protein [Myxococcota bacterium]
MYLIRDPRDVFTSFRIKRLCAFLDIEDSASLRRPTVGSSAWDGNSIHGDHFAGVSSAPVGRHRSQLSVEEVRRIESELAPAFERFGWRRTLHDGEDRV